MTWIGAYGIGEVKISKSLEAITPERRTGDEALPMGATLLSFWQWMGSDLVSNAFRGSLAEYFVALAMGAADGAREEWAKCDVETPDGIRIEVKTTAYVQAWKQKRLSSPQFGVARSLDWSRETGEYAASPTRSSDIYVFCFHHHREKATVNPLDLSQWTFYVLPTATLDREVGSQEKIGIGRLKSMGAVEVSFDGIATTVRRLYGEIKPKKDETT